MQTTTVKPNTLQVESISFSHTQYDEKGNYLKDKTWKCDFQLSGTGDTKNMSMRVGNDIATELMKVLLPIVTQSAANKAQELADAAKAQANELSALVLKQLPAQVEISE